MIDKIFETKLQFSSEIAHWEKFSFRSFLLLLTKFSVDLNEMIGKAVI